MKNIVTLKSRLEVAQGHSNWCTIRKLCSGSLFAFHSNCGYILHYFRDKTRYWSKVVIVSYPLHSTPLLGWGYRRNIAIPFGMEKLEWSGYPTVKINFDNMFSCFDRIPACDGQTDGRTDRVRAMHIRVVR